MISISSNKSNDIAKAITDLNLANNDIRKVFYTTLNRSALRAKNRLARDIAVELKLPLKVIRKRLFMYKKATSTTRDFKIWVGLNDIPFSILGTLKKSGKDILVKGMRAENAYVIGNRVVLRDSGEQATLKIDNNVTKIITQRLPYYFDDEFHKNFEQLLRYKFKK